MGKKKKPKTKPQETQPYQFGNGQKAVSGAYCWLQRLLQLWNTMATIPVKPTLLLTAILFQKKKKKGSFLGLHALASLCKWPELPCLPEASRNRAHNAVRRIACSRLPCYGYPLQTLPTWLRMQCSQSLLASARAGGQPPRGRDLLSAPSAGLKLQPGRSQSHLTKEYLRFVNKKQSCCYSSLSYWLAAP